MTLRVIAYCFFGMLAFVALVRYLEENSVFYPAKKILYTPQQIGLEYEDVYFKTLDHLKLNGWLIKNPRAKATIVFFHGNAGNNGDRLDTIAFYHDIGVNVFIVDYRGYGKSQGRPSERGIYKDAIAAYDYLMTRNDIDRTKIIGYGASLGGAAAIDLATKRKLAGLIVDSTFSSAVDMAKKIYPFIPSIFLKLKMDNVAKVKNLNIPKVFIHSQYDEVVPYILSRKLFEAAAPPKSFITVTCGHNELRQGSDAKRVMEGIQKFLKENGLL